MGRAEARARFDRCYEASLKARKLQPSGPVAFGIQSPLDDVVSACNLADRLLQEINVALADMEQVSASYNIPVAHVTNRRMHGYTLSLCMARALIHPALKSIELSRLLVLKDELEALRTHRLIVQGYARIALEEKEETSGMARQNEVSEQILFQVDQRLGDLRVALTAAISQSDEAFVMMQDVIRKLLVVVKE